MDEKQQEAIRLKYEGRTYSEISSAISVPESTVGHWFEKGGLLELSYEEHAKEQGKKKLSAALDVFKQQTDLAAQAMEKVLKTAIKNAEDAEKELEEHLKQATPAKTTTEDLQGKVRKTHNRMFDIAERILDRAGLTIINRTEVKKGEDELDESKLTTEQLKQQLRERGINPDVISYKTVRRPTAES